jgi:ATP-dependent HslUV protease ATP-binding subunit HslU
VKNLTPREIVAELDRHIVGQANAKRSVAVAVRNRWRRQQLDDDLRKEVAPKNILMIGPTGVGKTEIARRLARLTGAPFIKVEATKYTEVGYYGRDVESMIRELIENAIGLVREKELAKVEEEAKRRVTDRLLDLLAPAPAAFEVGVEGGETPERYERTREKMRAMLLGGELENRQVEIRIEQKAHAMMIPGMGPGGDSMDFDFQGMIEKILPKNVSRRQMTVADARKVLLEQETESMINSEKVNAQASWPSRRQRRSWPGQGREDRAVGPPRASRPRASPARVPSRGPAQWRFPPARGPCSQHRGRSNQPRCISSPRP